MSPDPETVDPSSQLGRREDEPELDHSQVTAASGIPTSGKLDTMQPDDSKSEIAHEAHAKGNTNSNSNEPDLIDLNDGAEQPVVGNPPSDVAQTAGGDKGVSEGSHLREPQDLMSSSVATLKPATSPTTTTATQYLSISIPPYVDPTPPTPSVSQPPSRTPSNAPSHSKHASISSEHSPTRSDAAYDDRRYASEDEQEGGSRSEIQSIMEQFSEAGGGPGEEEVMSPRLEIASPMLGTSIQHPPRKSSLDPLAPSIAQQLHDMQGLRLTSSSSDVSMRSKEKEKEEPGPPVPPKDETLPGDASTWASNDSRTALETPLSPSISLHRPPPPEPEPEPALPFDFHRFLEQLRNKKADPVARYLKSFLSEFAKRQWMVHEQVKIISDFLAFIANKMAQCDVWREVSDAEFDNAREGMEKLVMNRLYSQTFSPAIPAPQPIPGAKTKKRGPDRPMGPGRRGQHQEDVERDEILAQKINIYGWVRENHLDIPPVSDSGKRFLKLAQQGQSYFRSSPRYCPSQSY